VSGALKSSPIGDISSKLATMTAAATAACLRHRLLKLVQQLLPWKPKAGRCHRQRQWDVAETCLISQWRRRPGYVVPITIICRLTAVRQTPA